MVRRRLRRQVEIYLAEPKMDSSAIRLLKSIAGTRYLPKPLLTYPAQGADVERRYGRTTMPIVIEGYPRSGNSYAAATASLAYPESNVFSNTHSRLSRATVMRDGGFGLIPCRDPLDAIASLIVFTSSPSTTGGIVSAVRTEAQVKDEFDRFNWLLSVKPWELPRVRFISFDSVTTSGWLDEVASVLGQACVTKPNGSDIERIMSTGDTQAAVMRDEMRSSLPSLGRREVLLQVRSILTRKFEREIERSRARLCAVWSELEPNTVGLCPSRLHLAS